MAVVIDATVGGAAANSYSTQLEVDAYAEASSYAAAWAAVLSASKSAKIVRAARLLGVLAFPGWRATSTQALPWPRAGVETPAGGAYDTTSIPSAVKAAQAELCGWLAAADAASSDNPALDPFLGLANLSVGALTITPDVLRRTAPVQDFLARVVAPILRAGNCLSPAGVVRLVR